MYLSITMKSRVIQFGGQPCRTVIREQRYFCQGLSAMPSLSADDQQTIAELIALRSPGYSLPGAFYASDAVYRAEIARIWRRDWLFVGHTCELPNPGDYLTFSVESDSLIVIRDDDGRIHALWNVCRHRGT